MKKLILAIALTMTLFSCAKDEEIGGISFSTRFSKVDDAILYDAVSYLMVDYYKLNDSSDYHFSIKFDLDKRDNNYFSTEYFHVDKGTYEITKFDLVDKTGNILYCIPNTVPDDYKTNVENSVLPLPLGFSTSEADSEYNFAIVKVD